MFRFTPASLCVLRSVALWEAIRYEIQDDVVLKKSLQAGEHQRKSPRRIERLFYDLIAVSAKAGIRDTDESRAIGTRSKTPLHRCACAICPPLDEYSLILFNRFHVNVYREIVHFPIPADLFTRL